MNCEDFASLKLSKLLSDKNIVFDTDYCRIDNDSGIYKKYDLIPINQGRMLDAYAYLSPTLYDIQKWLRNTVGIYVYPSVYISKDNDEQDKYMAEAYSHRNNKWLWYTFKNWDKYETYEQALDSSMCEIIENIVLTEKGNFEIKND